MSELTEEMVTRIAALESRLDDLVQPAQAYHYQRINIVKGWDAVNNKASQVLNLQAAPWSLPAGIKAVSAYLNYTAANAGDWALLEKSNGDGPAVEAKLQVGGQGGIGDGKVNCDGSGDIYFRTNNAVNTVSLYIHGYFI